MSAVAATDGPVLVLGATGLLGCSLAPFLSTAGVKSVALGSRDLDLGERAATHAALDAIAPSVIINLAGLTNVDICESDPNLAYRANTLTSENIATWLRRSPGTSRLVQISTDHVYDGPGPHGEAAATLRNYYAFSKYCGEQAAASVGSTILRTNFFGRSRCPSRQTLSDWVYTSLLSGVSIQVFEDVYFSPLSMQTLCKAILCVLGKPLAGVFNLGSREGASKAEFAFKFAAACGLDTSSMSRASVDTAHALKARRPNDMRMEVRLFEEAFRFKLPTLESEIMTAAGEYDALC